MNDITFTILQIVCINAIALITAYLIPYLNSKLGENERNLISNIVNIAVQAAQQTITDNQLKKETVTNFVSRYLEEKHIKLYPEQLDKLIESAVYSMKQLSK